ncbi:MAG: hypothetical protein IT384_00510 [Deltaproteobacteria bacterium]|nr:hypothetical protein [Deltaproteobacteria bacterium]
MGPWQRRALARLNAQRYWARVGDRPGDRLGFPEYVTVEERRRTAEARLETLSRRGRPAQPVRIERRGRAIAHSFWGQAWCRNLEAYSDYANRLPRGRTYVRSGAVIDLEIAPRKIRAEVSGSELYQVTIGIAPLEPERWRSIVRAGRGGIDSMISLLRGELSEGMMAIVTDPVAGLFPSPQEIKLACSCPDWATMCKHVAATMYGVGARLDHEPRLLFELRDVDPEELVTGGGVAAALVQGQGVRSDKMLDTQDLSALFGIEIDEGPDEAPAPRAPPAKKAKRSSAKKSGRAAKSPARAESLPGKLTGAELETLGLDRRTIARWLARGLLTRHGKGDRYVVSAAAALQISSRFFGRKR